MKVFYWKIGGLNFWSFEFSQCFSRVTLLQFYSRFYYSRLDRTHLRRDLYMEGSQYEIFRPGFVRLSIPYHVNAQDAEYVIEAVELVAKYGKY